MTYLDRHLSSAFAALASEEAHRRADPAGEEEARPQGPGGDHGQLSLQLPGRFIQLAAPRQPMEFPPVRMAFLCTVKQLPGGGHLINAGREGEFAPASDR